MTTTDTGALIRAARQLVGDEEPTTPEEEAIIAEIKAEYGRPSREEIVALAKRLAHGSK